MSLGTRFRSCSGATSLKTSVGAALIGVALLGGTMGAALAQDASPEASPAASPVAAATWVTQVPVEAEVVFEGDRASVGVVLTDIAEINVASLESRPYLILQTDNQGEVAQNVVVLMVPEGFDATTAAYPSTEADLPEGATAVGGYSVEPGSQTAAVFQDLAVGSYVIVTDGGLVVPFAITERAELDVPNIFETPEDEGTPAA